MPVAAWKSLGVGGRACRPTAKQRLWRKWVQFPAISAIPAFPAFYLVPLYSGLAAVPGSVLTSDSMSSEIRLSVALVTRDRPDQLNNCLTSLRAQSVQPFEVILSDDSSADYLDATRAVAEKHRCIYSLLHFSPFASRFSE